MKRILLKIRPLLAAVVVILFQTIFLFGCATDETTRQSFREEPEGFRGIAWGTDVAAVPGMRFIKADPKNNGVKYYTRSSDELKFGNAKVNEVVYATRDDKFYLAWVKVNGVAQYAQLKDAVFQQFGPGHFFIATDDNNRLAYQWLGPKTRMFLRYNEFSEIAFLSWWSEELLKAHGE